MKVQIQFLTAKKSVSNEHRPCIVVFFNDLRKAMEVRFHFISVKSQNIIITFWLSNIRTNKTTIILFTKIINFYSRRRYYSLLKSFKIFGHCLLFVQWPQRGKDSVTDVRNRLGAMHTRFQSIRMKCSTNCVSKPACPKRDPFAL